jgi:raffinose/stachyose/melibiose transport system permease protein
MIKISRYRLRKHTINFLFLFPAFGFFFYVIILPFIQGIPLSFTNWNGVNPNYQWVGFDNYIALLKNPEFYQDIWNTFYFTFFYIILSNGLGLLFALAIYKSSKFNNCVRSVLFMPFVVSLITTAFIWSYIYTDVYTPLLNLPSPLAVPSQALLGLVVNAVWRDAGYCMLIYIAALQSVPVEFYEAAVVEGASRVNQFFKITVPMIMPAFTANFLLLLAWGLKVFDYPMAVTSGGPGRVTETMAMYVYNNIFGFMKAGYGQAAAILITVIMYVLSYVISKYFRSREVEI